MANDPRPILVAGAHRSGTTLTIQLLGDLGLWLGPNLDPNGEAVYFLRRNEGLLRAAGGAWDRPLPFLDWAAVPGRVEAVAAALAAELPTRRRIELTGRAWWGGARPLPRTRPWGFKDPRLVFTLPVWRRVFPAAPLILLRRDGDAVARSLQRRELSDGERPARELLGVAPMPGPSGLAALRPRLLQPYLSSARCLELEGARALWEEYDGAARRAAEEHDGPTLVLRYEELLAEPVEGARRLAEFAGLRPEGRALARAAARVDPSRATGSGARALPPG